MNSSATFDRRLDCWPRRRSPTRDTFLSSVQASSCACGVDPFTHTGYYGPHARSEHVSFVTSPTWDAERGRVRETVLSRAGWWALRDSNPRPSPCKSETNLLVRGLSCDFGVQLSTAQYLGLPGSCYAVVMRR